MHIPQYTSCCVQNRKRRLSFSSHEKNFEDRSEDQTLISPVTPPCSSSEIYPDSPASVLSYTEDSDYEEEPMSKVPRYIGTIYEERLAPLSPVTSLPVPVYVGAGHGNSKNNILQVKLLELINLGEETVLDEFLEENGKHVDINQYSEDGVTPLQLVCQEGRKVSIARVLVKYGADLKLTSRDGWSPIHMATFSGNLQLMNFIRNCPKWRKLQFPYNSSPD